MDNSDKKITDNVSYRVLENGAVFSNPHSFFVLKKIEKIIYALYLLTSHFSENEPLKWSIREVSTSLINDVVSITKRSSESQIRHLRNINRSLIEISSYLELSEKTALISSMNFSILNEEVRNVGRQIEDAIKGQQNVEDKNISDNVFKTSGSHKGQFNKGQEEVEEENKGHNNVLYKNKNIGGVSKTDTYGVTNKLKKVGNLDPEKKGRIEQVLNIIKDGGSVSIKEISEKIEGVSEKTIQRDLVKLIELGKVSKEGERRWSKYSFAEVK